MRDILSDVVRIVAKLNQEGVEYVVVGGVAMNLHGFVRATEDVDIFLKPHQENIARLRRALRQVWDDPEIDKIEASDLCGDYPAVRYGPPEGELYLDLLTRLGERVRYDDLETEEILLDHVPIRVASPKTLYWMKADTIRAIDKADAEALRQVFDLKEAKK